MFAGSPKTSLLTADCLDFCCSDRERSVADRVQTCQWYSRCRGRWRALALSTRYSSPAQLLRIFSPVALIFTVTERTASLAFC